MTAWRNTCLEDLLTDPDLIALADTIAYRGGIDPAPDDPGGEFAPNTEAQCPRCAVWRPIFVLALWVDEANARHFYCDGCRTQLVREGQDKAAVLQDLGAPADLVAGVAAATADPDVVVD